MPTAVVKMGLLVTEGTRLPSRWPSTAAAGDATEPYSRPASPNLEADMTQDLVVELEGFPYTSLADTMHFTGTYVGTATGQSKLDLVASMAAGSTVTLRVLSTRPPR
jgi:hypothetical protein